MNMKLPLIIAFLLLVISQVTSQKKYLFLEDFLKNEPNTVITSCLPNNLENKKFLNENKIEIKYETENWVFFSTSSNWVNENKHQPSLKDFYFEFSNPMAMADSAITRHKVNLVHQGFNLDTSYTGKDVIIGIVDQGIDFNHSDFKLQSGKTRVLRYWDHTVNGSNAPQPYNYGVVWDSSAINNGTCTSLETGTIHGSTVSGMAAGNGRANNRNKGVAPEADIIVVETNFNLQNWTLSIADACDYIFRVADSLGKPAVINLSLGTYLGSHDGKDPAAEYIDSLVEAKEGRIVVCAAGNAGAQGKFHIQNSVDQDTSFFWNLNNPGVTFVGNNKILFDLWADSSEANINFAFGADLPAPTYEFRGRTAFRNFLDNSNTFPMLYDTLYSSTGQRLACIETFREFEGSNFHMQVVFRTIDSLNYLYRFETFGSGKFDVWGGSWQKLSNFQTTIPTADVMPGIFNYVMPDTLQSIVSSWNCSDKVISVGNLRNRLNYIDKNNNIYTPSSTVAVGQLAETSSKGPSRNGVVKPDVSASGDLSLAAAPLSFLSNSANNSSIDQGGFHARNGGTSMSSPLVAGIAALYLQKCKNARYSDFKMDLINSSSSDAQSGITPNFGYGYGKVNAHETLLQKHKSVSITGPSGICVGQTVSLGYNSNMTPISVVWSNGFQSNSINTAIPGGYSVMLSDQLGCRTKGTKNLISYPLPFVDAGPNRIICPGSSITLTGTGEATTYAWNQTIQNNIPFVPTNSGFYTVTGTSVNGCVSKDSCFIDFFTIQPVNYSEIVTLIGTQDLAFNVTPGNPTGGFYSGSGIIGTSFHPGLAGVGEHYIVYSLVDANGCISSDSSLIVVYDNVGIKEIESKVKFFPNPTNDYLTIQTSKLIEMSCYSIEGRKIEEIRVGNEYILNVSNYANGLYYLEFKYGENRKPLYFIKN
jgi:subtilisin family serine protease